MTNILSLLTADEIAGALAYLMEFDPASLAKRLKTDAERIKTFAMAAFAWVMARALEVIAYFKDLIDVIVKDVTMFVDPVVLDEMWQKAEAFVKALFDKMKEFIADIKTLVVQYVDRGIEAAKMKIQPFRWLTSSSYRKEWSNPFKDQSELAKALNEKWVLGVDF
jgi:hypothetical protein